MYFKVLVYGIVSLSFLLIGFFISDNIIDKDTKSKLIYGNARVIYNIDYGFYSLGDLEFRISQILNIRQNFYSKDTKLITFNGYTQKEVGIKFDNVRKQIFNLDQSLKDNLNQKYLHYKNLVDYYLNESSKLSNSIEKQLKYMDAIISEIEDNDSNFDDLDNNKYDLIKEKITVLAKRIDTQSIREAEILDFSVGQLIQNQNLDIYMENLNKVNFKHEFISLSDIEYSDEHINIGYNSRLLITILFTLLGVFVAWCILEIRYFFSRRNSL